jgi:hypothetical protein
MKSKLTVLAITLFFLGQTVYAQQSRDQNSNSGRDRGAQNYNNNDTRNGLDYGTKRVRNNRNRAVMTERAFRQAMASMQHERFDSDKIKLAKLLVSRNNMTTAQIKAMAQLMSFDSSKLEFSKYAYTACVDRQNYYQIGRIFSFSSSREELYDYLARV